MAAVDDAPEVHVDDELMASRFGVFEMARAKDTGAVEHHVQPTARGLEELPQRRRHRGAVANVQAAGHGPPGTELSAQRLDRSLSKVVQADEPASPAEEFGCRATDPRPSP